MNEPVHSRLSPSTAHRWMKCPASVRRIESLPPSNKSNAAADDGTHSHTLLEYCLKHDTDVFKTVGLAMADHAGNFVVCKERADRVHVALNHIKTVKTACEEYGQTTVLPETCLKLASLTGRYDLDGTADVIIYNDNEVHVIDYKDGMRYVDVVDNEQLKQYAVGVLGMLTLQGKYVDKVVMTVIQPKLALTGGNPINSWTVSASEILAYVPDLIAAAELTDNPDAPAVAGEKQCHYCDYQGQCKEKLNHVLTESKISFTGTENLLTEVIEQSQDGAMTDEQLVSIIEAAPMITQLIEKAKEEAMRRLESGRPIEGLKLVEGRGQRKWRDDDPEKIAERLKKFGIPKDAIWEQKLVSPVTVLDKLTWTNKKGETKTLSEAQKKTLELDFVVKTAGKPTVALSSDKRKSISPDFAKLFSAVQSQQQPTETEAVKTNELPDFLS